MPKNSSNKDLVHVVSSDWLPGFDVKETKGMVWATTLSRIGLMGGSEDGLNTAKKSVVHRLVENAKLMGANAVIGTKMYTTSNVYGSVEVCAYGTAVIAKRK